MRMMTYASELLEPSSTCKSEQPASVVEVEQVAQRGHFHDRDVPCSNANQVIVVDSQLIVVASQLAC